MNQPKPQDSIIYTGESVVAILADLKTQTRRVMDPQPRLRSVNLGNGRPEKVIMWDPGEWSKANYPIGHPDVLKLSPFGEPGHTLWVREKIVYSVEHDNFYYDADKRGCGDAAFVALIKQFGREAFIKRPYRTARYMPNVCRRLQLRVIRIRVERLQDITEEDAIAEGVQVPVTTEGCPPGKARILTQLTGPSYKGQSFAPCVYLPTDPSPADFYRAHYASAWDSINAKRGYAWKSNPWLWVVDFERIIKP